MASGQKHSQAGPGYARMLALAVGVTATVVAWGVLVFAAIDFGRNARDGQDGDWMFLALATVGAVACMFLAIVLAARLQAMLRGGPTRPQPPHPHVGTPGPKGTTVAGKRAAR